MLLERYGCLGGLATGGLVIVLPPLVRGEHQVIGGIGQETLERLLDAGEAEYRSDGGSSRFDPEGLKRLSDEMCVEAGVFLRLHSWVVGVFGEQGRPEGAIVESKAGRQAVRAQMIVDCTGDGDVATMAGAGFERDDKMIGLPFRIGNIDLDRWSEARSDGSAGAIHKEAHQAAGYESHFGLSPFPLNPGVAWGNNHMAPGDFLDPDVLTRMEIRGRRAAKTVLDLVRAKMPGFENSWLIDTASADRRPLHPGGSTASPRCATRSSLAERSFDDSVALGNDFPQAQRGLQRSRRLPHPAGPGRRCWSAGRCVSGDAEAMEALREIHCCWTMGEAAGVAAAMAAERGVEPAELPVPELPERLTQARVVVDLPPRA